MSYIDITPEAPAPLTLADRCDASPSGTEQALVRYAKDGKTLQFCAAHNRRHEEALTLGGWKVEVHDLTDDGFAAKHGLTAAY